MTIDEIRELVQLVLDTGVAELEVSRGDDSVRIRRQPETHELMVPAAGVAHVAPSHAMTGAPAAPAAPAAEEEKLEQVKSPIVGTFYEAPSPEADPFVKPGDHVTPGQVLCIIESMKLMNEIESEVSGVVVQRMVDNGKPVEYGETLFTIRPA